jgi:hypothetical protein
MNGKLRFYNTCHSIELTLALKSALNEIKKITLNGGSLGSWVDEERS